MMPPERENNPEAAENQHGFFRGYVVKRTGNITISDWVTQTARFFRAFNSAYWGPSDIEVERDLKSYITGPNPDNDYVMRGTPLLEEAEVHIGNDLERHLEESVTEDAVEGISTLRASIRPSDKEGIFRNAWGTIELSMTLPRHLEFYQQGSAAQENLIASGFVPQNIGERLSLRYLTGEKYSDEHYKILIGARRARRKAELH